MRGAWVMWAAGACAPIGATPSKTGSSSASGGSPTTSPTPDRVEDRFLQDQAAAVDVLFVVQDTAGMADLQATLTDDVPVFFDSFLGSGLDYHLGVVTTDCDDPARSGKLVEAGGQRWLEPSTPDPLGLFSQMAVAGEDAATSQPLGATYLALGMERDLANAGFYREGAALRVIAVGDGSDATDPAIVDPATFAAWFAGLKADRELATFSCLVDGALSGGACEATAASLGGEVVSALDPLVGLELLGLHSVGLDLSYTLSVFPVPDTLEVQVENLDGSVYHFDELEEWTYDAVANEVSFLEFVPNALTTIVISYEPAR